MPPLDRHPPSWQLWDVPAALALSLVALVVVASDAPAVLRVPIGLGALFLAPGYAWTCALFPRRPRGESAIDIDAGPGSPMSAAMRFAVAIGMSTAVLILVTIAVESVGPLTELRVLGMLAVLTAVATAIWYARRSRSPKPSGTPAPVSGGRTPPESRSLAILLVAAMVLAGLAGAYALLNPRDAPEFTALYLTASDGIQHCFPDRHLEGAYGFDGREEGCAGLTPDRLLIGVTNHEGRAMDYWLRTVWTREVLAEDNLTDVLEAHVIGVWQVSLDSIEAPDDPNAFQHEAQYEIPFELPPPPSDGDWRLSVQLYTEEPPPAAPSRAFLEGPYKRVHLIIHAFGVQ